MTETNALHPLGSTAGLDAKCAKHCDFENAKLVSRAKWCCPDCGRDYSIEYVFWAQAAHPEWFVEAANDKVGVMVSTARNKSRGGDPGGLFAIGADRRRVKPSNTLLDERGTKCVNTWPPDHNVKGTHIMAESIIPQSETNLDEMDDEQFGELMLARLRAAPALLDESQVYAIESKIQGDVTRRAAFAIASVAGDELLEKISTDREFAVAVGDVFNSLGEVKARYQHLLTLFESIHSRLTIAVAVREDMEEILAESRTVPLH